jgi:mannobiose 2-epimerase
LNTHLHLLEALTRFADLRPDARVSDALNELTYVLGNTVVRKGYGACTDHHEEDWSVPQSKDRRRVVYGHDLESIWFLIEAAAKLQLPSSLLLDLFETLFFNAWRYGYDHAHGGFYLRGHLGRFAADRDKIWWVEAEALVCALHLYVLTHRRVYFDVFAKTLEWVTVHQVDWERGEWYLRTNRAGRGSGEKAHERSGVWKCAYHNGRAMLRCIELIDALLARPGGPARA